MSSSAIRTVRPTETEPDRVRHRWTVEEYQAAAEAGVFGPEARVELIDGEIFDMSPQDGPHIAATGLTRGALETAFGAGWVVLSQMTLLLAPGSAPEPDLCVVHGTWRDLVAGPPTSAALVVEVSATTLRFDRGPKASVYARAGIAEYWIVNLIERVLEVHREPEPAAGKYRTVFRLGEEETVSPLAAPDAVIAVRDLLP